MVSAVAKLSAFEESLSGVTLPSGYADLRRRAMDRFRKLGLPTTKDEEWRFTSTREIAESAFDFCGPDVSVSLDDVDEAAKGDGPRLVFVNGRFSERLSDYGSLPSGIIVANIADKSDDRVGSIAEFDDAAFVALNTALFEDGYFVRVPKGMIVETLIYAIFVSTEGAASNPRNLLILEENSQATIIESYVGMGGKSFTNAVTEGFIGDGAVLEHAKLQLGSEEAIHITTQQWTQDRGSNTKSTTVTLGGALVRNDTNSILDGEGCESTINGLYVTRGEQHVDNHSRLDHAKAHCPSHELFKGVLDDKSSAVFNGKIIVRPDAQKTDSKQSNMNLLLSDDAVINTKPQLEIFADDVRCTHGATIGRLDSDAMFYLRSRGIPEHEARNLLIYAFASDVIDRIRVPELAERLEKMLFERFAERK